MNPLRHTSAPTYPLTGSRARSTVLSVLAAGILAAGLAGCGQATGSVADNGSDPDAGSTPAEKTYSAEVEMLPEPADLPLGLPARLRTPERQFDPLAWTEDDHAVTVRLGGSGSCPPEIAEATLTATEDQDEPVVMDLVIPEHEGACTADFVMYSYILHLPEEAPLPTLLASDRWEKPMRVHEVSDTAH